MKSKINQIAISMLPGVGPIVAKKLIAYCGGAEAVLSEKKNHLKKIPGIGEVLAEKVAKGTISAIRKAEKELELCEKLDIHPHYFLEESYPKRLFHCEDGPIVLYSKGSVNLNTSRMISIVGTRNATVKGKAFCESLVKGLEVYQPTIISGLAYGIDITAHKAAINHELQTLAVLATGLNEIYPKSHAKYVKQICQNGGLLSDYSQESKLLPVHFAERNRIVAGMSDAVIVIESSSKGGSLITADLANGYNRDVFAVPGRTDDSQSKGCNQLIKANKAALIESAEDIAYLLSWDKVETKQPVQKSLFIELSGHEQSICNELKDHDKLSIDEISLRSQLSMSETTVILLDLEFKGVVKSYPGKMFKWIG